MNNSKKTMREIILELEEENLILSEVGSRGGSYGVATEDVLTVLFPTLDDEKLESLSDFMPQNFGVHVNYLGGGIRGSIILSDYDEKIPVKYAKHLDSFARECKKRYLEIENESGLNDEEYEEGGTNWESIGTKKSRTAGIESAY